ncbi:arsenate reductase family protein [Synechococcus sp. CC9311]|uniref:arsenate reductase family protein n=1 Tax=Synechococcus sp. (strain CC9311) TaxID=64471 RepID=UPI0000DDB0C6|nr:arsenate reductase family protein [Synechococcus sp. CC9311]ABI46162.1 arsenate reductase BH3485 [Synechococcus sp. CC9311]
MAPPIKVYSYSRCSTCRKALAWLDANNLAYEVVDITIAPPSKEVLSLAFERLVRRQLLFNTSGQSYRALGAQVVKAMSDDDALTALAADGRLIKRPFVALPSGDFLVGFKPEDWNQALLG